MMPSKKVGLGKLSTGSPKDYSNLLSILVSFHPSLTEKMQRNFGGDLFSSFFVLHLKMTDKATKVLETTVLL